MIVRDPRAEADVSRGRVVDAFTEHVDVMPTLLFDLQNDPGELNDLASQPAHLDTVLEYAQRMLSWRMRHADKTLTHIALTNPTETL
jgi:arylsulfatase A-like enzyme